MAKGYLFLDADNEFITDASGNKVRNPYYHPIKDKQMRSFFTGYSVAIQHVVQYFDMLENSDLTPLVDDINTDFLKEFDRTKPGNEAALGENSATRTTLALKEYLLINLSNTLDQMLTKASEDEAEPHSDRMA